MIKGFITPKLKGLTSHLCYHINTSSMQNESKKERKMKANGKEIYSICIKEKEIQTTT